MVTTIIPTIGRDTLWSRALPSVMAQTVPDWRCIVVGDGVELDPVADPRVTVTSIPAPDYGPDRWRVGGAAAFNAGLDLADTEWVSYLADDDAYRPDHHAVLLAASDDTDVVYGQSQPHRRNGSATPGRLFGDRYPLEPFDVVQGAYILRRLVAGRAVTTPEPVSWDALWWTGLLVRNVRIRRVSAVVHDYYPAPENAHHHGADTWG